MIIITLRQFEITFFVSDSKGRATARAGRQQEQNSQNENRCIRKGCRKKIIINYTIGEGVE
jgi:hypothetical protein